MNGGDEVYNKKDRVVSPILFLCEDDDREEPKSEPLPTQKSNRCVIKRNVFLFFCQFICNKKRGCFRKILKIIIYPPVMLTVDVIFGRVNNRY